MKHCRLYLRTSLKIVRHRQHIAFNTRCKRYDIIPRSLQVKPLVSMLDGRRIARRASFQFLSAIIDEGYRTLWKLEQDLRLQKSQLPDTLQPQHLRSLEELRESAEFKEKSKVKERHKRKFDTLLKQCEPRRSRDYPERWVVNLSSKKISTRQKAVLSKGLNFAPAPKCIPTKEIVASVDSALKRVSQDSASSVRTRMILLRSTKPPASNLTPGDMKAISTLKKDQEGSPHIQKSLMVNLLVYCKMICVSSPSEEEISSFYQEPSIIPEYSDTYDRTIISSF